MQWVTRGFCARTLNHFVWRVLCFFALTSKHANRNSRTRRIPREVPSMLRSFCNCNAFISEIWFLDAFHPAPSELLEVCNVFEYSIIIFQPRYNYSKSGSLEYLHAWIANIRNDIIISLLQRRIHAVIIVTKQSNYINYKWSQIAIIIRD